MDGVRGLLGQAGEAAERAAALAAVADALAGRVRLVAWQVEATQDTPWRSVAADAFRSGVLAVAVSLGRAADDLDGAGRALRAHAATAAERARWIAGLAGTVDRLLDEGLDEPARAALESLQRALPRSWGGT